MKAVERVFLTCVILAIVSNLFIHGDFVGAWWQYAVLAMFVTSATVGVVTALYLIWS